jgi:hypothetical protein
MRRFAPQFISRSPRFSATSAVIFLFVSFVPLWLNRQLTPRPPRREGGSATIPPCHKQA